jgi:hypothetical protein
MYPNILCAFIDGDTSRHKIHMDISLNVKMNFCNRCCFAIQRTTITSILYYNFNHCTYYSIGILTLSLHIYDIISYYQKVKLAMEEERALAVFERKILPKIYGPVKEHELWRIRQNDELEAIINGENVVRFIKCQRIRRLGHIERMQDTAIPKNMLYGKLYATRRRGRPKKRWLDDVFMDLRKMGVNE